MSCCGAARIRATREAQRTAARVAKFGPTEPAPEAPAYKAQADPYEEGYTGYRLPGTPNPQTKGNTPPFKIKGA